MGTWAHGGAMPQHARLGLSQEEPPAENGALLVFVPGGGGDAGARVQGTLQHFTQSGSAARARLPPEGLSCQSGQCASLSADFPPTNTSVTIGYSAPSRILHQPANPFNPSSSQSVNPSIRQSSAPPLPAAVHTTTTTAITASSRTQEPVGHHLQPEPAPASNSDVRGSRSSCKHIAVVSKHKHKHKQLPMSILGRTAEHPPLSCLHQKPMLRLRSSIQASAGILRTEPCLVTPATAQSHRCQGLPTQLQPCGDPVESSKSPRKRGTELRS